jgi:hypothetical protein
MDSFPREFERQMKESCGKERLYVSELLREIWMEVAFTGNHDRYVNKLFDRSL